MMFDKESILEYNLCVQASGATFRSTVNWNTPQQAKFIRSGILIRYIHVIGMYDSYEQAVPVQVILSMPKSNQEQWSETASEGTLDPSFVNFISATSYNSYYGASKFYYGSNMYIQLICFEPTVSPVFCCTIGYELL